MGLIDNSDPDPMLAEQFEVALAATQIRAPELIAACRAVLVDGMLAPEAAKVHNVTASSIYRATASIRQKWEKICTKQDWVYAPVAAPREVMDVILAFQRNLLSAYQQRGKKRRGKK